MFSIRDRFGRNDRASPTERDRFRPASPSGLESGSARYPRQADISASSRVQKETAPPRRQSTDRAIHGLPDLPPELLAAATVPKARPATGRSAAHTYSGVATARARRRKPHPR